MNNNKNPSKYLIMRINEYQMRYETQYKHPELNNLLNIIIKYILDTEKKHDEVDKTGMSIQEDGLLHQTPINEKLIEVDND